MKTWKVDLDYESSLFDPNYNCESASSKKIIREFEYVFFLVQKEKSILKNYKNYESKYLQSLRYLGFTIPDLNPEASEYDYWWGFHHDLTIEKNLNSKLTSAAVAKEQGWGFHEGALISSVEQLREHLKLFPEKNYWIIKRPHSFSGIGHYQFSSLEINELVISKILTGPCLLEPVYNRIFDIGTTFVIQDAKILKSFMVENFNSKSGAFHGGAGCKNVENFKKYIESKYNFDLSELEAITKNITTNFLNKGAVSNIQIDSFVYLENNKMKLYPLVEINYRKTMGLVIQSLAEKFLDSECVEWRIEPAKTSVLVNNSEWLKLSPEGNHFHSYLKLISKL